MFKYAFFSFVVITLSAASLARADEAKQEATSLQVDGAFAATATNQSSDGSGAGGLASAKLAFPRLDFQSAMITIEGSGGKAGDQLLGSGALGIRPQEGKSGVLTSLGVDCTNPALCTYGQVIGARVPVNNGTIDVQTRLPLIGGIFEDRTNSSEGSPISYSLLSARVGIDKTVLEALKVKAFLEGNLTHGRTLMDFKDKSDNNQRGLGFLGMAGAGLQMRIGSQVSLLTDVGVTTNIYKSVDANDSAKPAENKVVVGIVSRAGAVVNW